MTLNPKISVIVAPKRYVRQALLPQRYGFTERIKGTMILFFFGTIAENPRVTGIFDKKKRTKVAIPMVS